MKEGSRVSNFFALGGEDSGKVWKPSCFDFSISILKGSGMLLFGSTFLSHAGWEGCESVLLGTKKNGSESATKRATRNGSESVVLAAKKNGRDSALKRYTKNGCRSVSNCRSCL